MATRVEDSSAMPFSSVKAAMRDCQAFLLTERGGPRLVRWISSTASSENSVSCRPAIVRRCLIQLAVSSFVIVGT
ncbi:hypothetical protein AV521_31675 [Streptomyces sp. IMTB 2501]|nr:hypothetical protein AV521_31675 [Streptomyces sp. IMTB 2501]